MVTRSLQWSGQGWTPPPPSELGVSKSMACDTFSLQCSDTGQQTNTQLFAGRCDKIETKLLHAAVGADCERSDAGSNVPERRTTTVEGGHAPCCWRPWLVWQNIFTLLTPFHSRLASVCLPRRSFQCRLSLAA